MDTPSHQTVRLSAGRHSSPDEGVCIMELASMLAGDRFTDSPRGVSRCLAPLLRGYNDGLDDDRRQALKRFAPEVLGTAGSRSAERRRRRLIRSSPLVPAGRPRVAARLAALDPYADARHVGARVARDGDDELHRRMLALVDELVAVGASGSWVVAQARVVLAPAPAPVGDRGGG